jgi:hypothetical protein
MLREGVTPVIPGQGSVGASGDLAPLAHMAAAMIGEGEAIFGGERMPAAEALAEAGLEPVVWAEGRPGADQRHAVLHRLCAGRSVRRHGAMRGNSIVLRSRPTRSWVRPRRCCRKIHAARPCGQIDGGGAMRA